MLQRYTSITLSVVVTFLLGILTNLVSNNIQNLPWLANKQLVWTLTFIAIAINICLSFWQSSTEEKQQPMKGVSSLISQIIFGQRDERILVIFLENFLWLIAHMIVWAIIFSLIWIACALLWTSVAYILGEQVVGIWQSVKIWGILGLVIGAIAGTIISTYTFHKRNS